MALHIWKGIKLLLTRVYYLTWTNRVRETDRIATLPLDHEFWYPLSKQCDRKFDPRCQVSTTPDTYLHKIIKNIKLFLKIFQSCLFSFSLYPETPRFVFPSIKLGFYCCLCAVQVSVFGEVLDFSGDLSVLRWVFRQDLLWSDICLVNLCSSLSTSYWLNFSDKSFQHLNWLNIFLFFKKVNLLHQVVIYRKSYSFLITYSRVFWSFEKFARKSFLTAIVFRMLKKIGAGEWFSSIASNALFSSFLHMSGWWMEIKGGFGIWIWNLISVLHVAWVLVKQLKRNVRFAVIRGKIFYFLMTVFLLFDTFLYFASGG